MPSQDFTSYTTQLKERDGKKVFTVDITVTNAAGDCDITRTNDADAEDTSDTTGNIDTMCLREELLVAP